MSITPLQPPVRPQQLLTPQRPFFRSPGSRITPTSSASRIATFSSNTTIAATAGATSHLSPSSTRIRSNRIRSNRIRSTRTLWLPYQPAHQSSSVSRLPAHQSSFVSQLPAHQSSFVFQLPASTTAANPESSRKERRCPRSLPVSVCAGRRDGAGGVASGAAAASAVPSSSLPYVTQTRRTRRVDPIRLDISNGHLLSLSLSSAAAAAGRMPCCFCHLCHSPLTTAAAAGKGESGGDDSTGELEEAHSSRQNAAATAADEQQQQNQQQNQGTKIEEEGGSSAVELAVRVLKCYKREISPWIPASCRFVPTCSEYSVTALRRYGLQKGLILTAWRLLRCNPLGPSGYDPPRWFGEPPPPSV